MMVYVVMGSFGVEGPDFESVKVFNEADYEKAVAYGEMVANSMPYDGYEIKKVEMEGIL